MLPSSALGADEMRIVVLDGYTVNPGDNSWDALTELGELAVFPRTPSELLLERSRDAEVLVTNKVRIDASAISALPRLRGVAVTATGYNVVDVAAAQSRNVWVSNVPDYGAASVAQHTIALLLELTQKLSLHAAAVRAGEWSAAPDFCFWKEPLVELEGLTLGVVGYGAIGRRVGELGASFGMRVLATASKRSPSASGVETATLDRLFTESDVLSLHCPLTAETERLVRWERLVTMKPSALLLNTARGGLIDEADLARALEGGVIAGAGLDVLSVEPPPPDHPLISIPRCLITPHHAWTTLAARRRIVRATVENVRGFLRGAPQNLVF